MYRIVEEWGCPIYVDIETSEHLCEASDYQRLSYWVCKIKDGEIVDYVEQFQHLEEAEQYIREIGQC